MKARSFVTLCFALVSVAYAQNWSGCSKTCGGGTKTRERCIFKNVCMTVYRPCNTHQCVSEWKSWQSCSRTCGGGTRFRVFKCPDNSFKTCRKHYEDCNTHNCDALRRCPAGQRFRYHDPSSCCKPKKDECGQDNTISTPFIVDGKPAPLGRWPWTAAIVRADPVVRPDGHGTERMILCGGSILNKRWIVTAAHCFDDPPIAKYVLLGSVKLNNESADYQKFNISDYKIHEGYDNVTWRNDIALVELDKDIKYTINIKPICLPTGEIVQQGTKCITAGWGLTSSNVKSYSNDLLQVRVRIVPLQSCFPGSQNRDDYYIYKQQYICAGVFTTGQDSCKGDSGGPLMCQRCSSCGWYLAGTVSHGPWPCGYIRKPAVYMNVYHYQYWIKQFVSLPSKKYYVC